MNCHYIPKLLLRRFSIDGKHICLYDLSKKRYRPDIDINSAFAIDDYYSDDIEKLFNTKSEGSFGDLLNHLVLKTNDNQIVLTRTQLLKIKKFLLLLIIRAILKDGWIKGEMAFQETTERLLKRGAMDGSSLLFPFKEKKIDGETTREYWLRTIRCLLNSPNGLPEEVSKDPNATMMAWRWAAVVQSGYLGFWSSRQTDIDFLVTDVGMTSESETALPSGMPINPLKMQALIDCANCLPNEPSLKPLRERFLNAAFGQIHLHENFMEFPISRKLMIVLINPYFKHFFNNGGKGLPFPPFGILTKMSDESAFLPNEAKPIKEGEKSPDDLYTYAIHDLATVDCIYLNMLTLDRVNVTLGFGDPLRIYSSLCLYQLVDGKLNDYSSLIEQIKGSIERV